MLNFNVKIVLFITDRHHGIKLAKRIIAVNIFFMCSISRKFSSYANNIYVPQIGL